MEKSEKLKILQPYIRTWIDERPKIDTISKSKAIQIASQIAVIKYFREERHTEFLEKLYEKYVELEEQNMRLELTHHKIEKFIEETMLPGMGVVSLAVLLILGISSGNIANFANQLVTAGNYIYENTRPDSGDIRMFAMFCGALVALILPTIVFSLDSPRNVITSDSDNISKLELPQN